MLNFNFLDISGFLERIRWERYPLLLRGGLSKKEAIPCLRVSENLHLSETKSDFPSEGGIHKDSGSYDTSDSA